MERLTREEMATELEGDIDEARMQAGKDREGAETCEQMSLVRYYFVSIYFHL